MGRNQSLHGRGRHLVARIALAVLAGPVSLPLYIAAAQLPASQAVAGVRSNALPNSTIDLAELESQFATIAERVAPSVVAISAACDPIDADDIARSDELNPERLERRLSGISRTVGTGFVIDADGYIATNEHVIAECEQIWVTTDDRKVYPAIVVGSDPRADLAVLKIPARGLKPVRFAPPNSIKRGQWTIALGNPYGMATEGEMAMSVGVISATERSLQKLSSKENRLYTNLLQTTAEINPGNSGGPLFNLAGEVVGINTAVVLPNKNTNGLGFAIPALEGTQAALQSLRHGEEVVYGYVGLIVSNATARDRRDAGVDAMVGARVDVIEADSPAADTKLRTGDVIVSFNGEKITSSDQFVRLIGSAHVNRAAEIRMFRDGQSATIELTPRRRPMPSVAVNRQNQRLRWRGMVLGAIPENWTHATPTGDAEQSATASRSGLMVIGLDESSPYAKELSIGSIITSIGGKTVASISELQSMIDGTLPEKLGEIQTLSNAAIASTND